MTRLLQPEVGLVSQVEFDMGWRGKRLPRPLNLPETGALNCDPRHIVSGFFDLMFGQPLPLLVTGPGVYRRLVRAGCLAFRSQLPKGVVVVAEFRVLPLLGSFRLLGDT